MNLNIEEAIEKAYNLIEDDGRCVFRNSVLVTDVKEYFKAGYAES